MPKITKHIDGKDVEVELSLEELISIGGDDLKSQLAPKTEPKATEAPATAHDTKPLQKIVDMDSRISVIESGLSELLKMQKQSVEEAQAREKQEREAQAATKAKTKAEELFKAGKIAKEEIETATKRLTADYENFAEMYDKMGGTKKPSTKQDNERSGGGQKPSEKPSGAASFTREEIANMSPAEYEKNREDILKAEADGMIVE